MPFAKSRAEFRGPIFGKEMFSRSIEAAERRATIDDWYLALLSTQQPEGWFDGWGIPAKRLGMTLAEAKMRVLALSGDCGLPTTVGGQDREQLLVTWLATRLLAESPGGSPHQPPSY